MKHIYILTVLLLAAFTFLACGKKQQQAASTPAEPEYYKIRQFESQPFLGETTIKDYDFEAGNQMLLRHGGVPEQTGACSSCRNGNFIGRNLDWYVKDYAILVVHIPADKAKGRLASVGACSSNPFITRELIASGVVSDTVSDHGKQITGWRQLFPVFTTDGINERGLCVNENIVMHEEGVRKGYIPCTGQDSMPKTSFIALPRYILDYCTSCDDAIQKLSRLSVTQGYQGPLATEDCHFMISDSLKTVVVEWRDNRMAYTEYPKSNKFRSAHGMPCIMTNFYNCMMDSCTTDSMTDMKHFYELNPYAMGVERYQDLIPDLDQVNSVEAMEKHIERVLYSKFYNMETRWYTENTGCYTKQGAGWIYPTDTAKTKYGHARSIEEAMLACYNSAFQEDMCTAYGSLDQQMRALDKGQESDKWYTELTSIFDIKRKELYIMPQEGWYKHEYIKFRL